jgi:hypothetical protein
MTLLSQNIVDILNNARTLPRIEEQLGILRMQIETDVKGGSLGDTANTTVGTDTIQQTTKGKRYYAGSRQTNRHSSIETTTRNELKALANGFFNTSRT